MNEVLYRKYRPSSFSQVKGQEHIIPILIESVTKGKVSHAYLFAGPRGCGKTSVARLMAKAVNCENFAKLGDICNECDNCTSINSGSAIDIIEMDAASNRGIEEIRNLKDTINFMPSYLKKKVYIIDEAHMLTKEAFNALLKTLEEPPAHVMFILATTEAHKIPITILSRVMRFDFRFGNPEEILGKLKDIVVNEVFEIPEEGLSLIYRFSGGSFRDAESLLGKVILSSSDSTVSLTDIQNLLGIVPEEKVNEFIDSLLNGEYSSIENFVDVLIVNDSSASNLIDQMLEILKDRIVRSIEDNISFEKLAKLADLLLKIKPDLKDFSDKKLILKIELIKAAKLLGQSTVNSPQPLVNNQSPKNIKPKEETVPPQKEEELKPAKPSGNDVKDFIDMTSAKLASSFPRYKGIVSNSRIEVSGNTLSILNPYKFNINYLSKKELREVLMQIASEIWKRPLSLNLSIGAGVSEGQPEKVEEVPVPKEQEMPKKPVKKIDKVENLKDNSTLIETMF